MCIEDSLKVNLLRHAKLIAYAGEDNFRLGLKLRDLIQDAALPPAQWYHLDLYHLRSALFRRQQLVISMHACILTRSHASAAHRV